MIKDIELTLYLNFRDIYLNTISILNVLLDIRLDNMIVNVNVSLFALM